MGLTPGATQLLQTIDNLRNADAALRQHLEELDAGWQALFTALNNEVGRLRDRIATLEERT